MPFRSIVQDMREEIGSISKKGFKARSQRGGLVNRSAVPAAKFMDSSKMSCWSSIPVELLREVLSRIEDSEGSWPGRKSVVSCAGVCRSWREIVKELVKKPEVSGELTFPISLKQPGPRDCLVQCFIKRNRSAQTYHLYLGLTRALADNGKFLLAASRSRHLTCTDYTISMNPADISNSNDAYIGKLRSNFLGTKFVVYDAMAPHVGATMVRSRSTRLGAKQVSPRVPHGNFPIAHITYELNVLNSRGPRKMRCTMNSIPAAAIKEGGSAPTPTQLPPERIASSPSSSLFHHRSKSSLKDSFSPAPSMAEEELLIMENKSPRWHEQLQCWCLNFRGRVTVASVKNFQLAAASSSSSSSGGGCSGEKILLQFGKVGKDLFTMDYQYPLSAFQAFAVCLSSFDTKIACK